MKLIIIENLFVQRSNKAKAYNVFKIILLMEKNNKHFKIFL